LLTPKTKRSMTTRPCNIYPTYAHCWFDGNAVFNTAFATSDVSTRDYFHPSPTGQAKLAAVMWSAGYWGATNP
jgi:hypothetical protein